MIEPGGTLDLAAADEARQAFWREQLAGAVALELPADGLRSVQARGNGATEPLRCSEAAAPLRRLAAAHGVSEFTVLLAAYATLLGRHAGTDDVVVGTIVSTCDGGAEQAVGGPLQRTLPLRVALTGDPTFGELLGRAGDVVAEAFAHRDVPFERSAPPLIQALLVVEPPSEPPALRPSSARVLPTPMRTAQLDLSLVVQAGSEPLEGFWEYDDALFGAATVQRWDKQLGQLIARAAEDPRRRLGELTTPLALRTAARSSNRRSAPSPPPLLHELVAHQAARTPDAPAVTAGDASLTYAELDRAATTLARRLRAAGVGHESLVGVGLPRSLLLPVAVLGVLKAGGAYVPLDPAHPPARTAFVVEDTRMRVAVVGTGDQSPPVERLLVLGDELLAGGEAAPEGDADAGVSADALAYVLHTSGSTGRPKGVAVSHGAASRFVAWTLEVFGRERFAVVPFTTSLGFDVSVFELFGTLAAGGRLVMLENALSLAERDRDDLTLLSLVPSVALELATLGPLPGAAPAVVLVGEAVSAQLARTLLAAGASRVWNCYGPTEATVFVTAAPVDGADARPPFGRPMPGVDAHVLDPQMRPVLPGATGELHLGGGCLARGYLGRAALTAERFLPDPFSTEPGARIYRTGDLVRERPDGQLVYVGRTDDQVKLRGFRIEPGEIEAALVRQDGVGEAAVALAGEGGRRLVAFVRCAPGGALPSPDRLRDAVASELPAHMVPETIVVVSTMPRTSSGKVDRAALLALHASDVDPRRAPSSPPHALRGDDRPSAALGEAERLVAGCWGRVLGTCDFPAGRSFFEVGGHSLLLLRLRAELGEAFGCEPSLAELVRYPHIGAMARHLADADAEAAS